MTVELVSVAIPLYRSARFFDVIVENIENIDYPNVEIIVSDRHMADDTIDRIAARFTGDKRLRLLRARDEIGWVEHYNLLLRAARGRYMCWMPHDDSFPCKWIPELVACLENDPGAVLAGGSIEPRVLPGSGKRRLHGWSMPPQEPPRSVAESRALLERCRRTTGFHGVFRRDRIARRGLWIRPTRDGVRADRFWLAALALTGRFKAVNDVVCIKRVYPQSTHVQWPSTAGHEINGLRVMGEYIIQIHGVGWRSAVLFCGAAFWMLPRLSRPVRKRSRRLRRLSIRAAKRPLHSMGRVCREGLLSTLRRLWD